LEVLQGRQSQAARGTGITASATPAHFRRHLQGALLIGMVSQGKP
jgi:hypothetical protein